MRKWLILSLFWGLCTLAYAQSSPGMADDACRRAMVKVYETPQDIPVNAPVHYPSQAINTKDLDAREMIIGVTYYDLQTYKSISDRFCLYDDGSMGAVWTMGMEPSNFPDRNTGYNIFDGNTWNSVPSTNLESFKSGWPSYAPLGADGEIIVSHDFANHELFLMQREQKGYGSWQEKSFTYSDGPSKLSWPRLTTAGANHNVVHLLANSCGEYMGLEMATVYSRSIDGGETWANENVILSGMGADDYSFLGADEYVWAKPVGNTIAFLMVSAWHDLFMMKSTDNGLTWDKTVIWEHPYPFFAWETTITDTFFCVDNSASIALDKNGKAHVVFGISRVLHETPGNAYNLFPLVDGIGYWNEDMPAFSPVLNALAPPQYHYPGSEMEENYNFIGWAQDMDGDGVISYIKTPTSFPMVYREMGISTMPVVAVGDDGTVLVLYSSTTEGFDNYEYNFKHIWARACQNGSWGPFVDLTDDVSHTFDECILPVFGGIIGDSFHYIYHADNSPGTAVDGDHAYNENRIIYARVPLTELLTGIQEEEPGLADSQVKQNYPNPFSGETHIRVNLQSSEYLSMEVRNTMGQLVYQMDKGRVKPGEHFFTFESGNLSKGVYFYTIIAGKNSITRKMVVN